MSGYPIVDFHNHFVGPRFGLKPLDQRPPDQESFWEDVYERLSSTDELLASVEYAGVDARVVSTPLEFLHDGGGSLPRSTIERINDGMASLVSRHYTHLYGLATVDAYDGDFAARELDRAIRVLGLRGVFMESAKGRLMPDAPEARPTLTAAAALGVPIFLHPVADPELESRLRNLGQFGVRLSRSTINSAAVYALLQHGVFDELPSLRVVVTSLALGGLLLAAGLPGGSRLRKEALPNQRRHVYIDTTGMDPVGVHAAIELVGADHVLMGNDWPVVQEGAVTARLHAMFEAFGLSAQERHDIAGSNALRLLGVS